MTKKELIKALEKFSDDAKVFIESDDRTMVCLTKKVELLWEKDVVIRHI